MDTTLGYLYTVLSKIAVSFADNMHYWPEPTGQKSVWFSLCEINPVNERDTLPIWKHTLTQQDLHKYFSWTATMQSSSCYYYTFALLCQSIQRIICKQEVLKNNLRQNVKLNSYTWNKSISVYNKKYAQFILLELWDSLCFHCQF